MESHEKDYYSILQVHPDAEPEVIKVVYRRLSQKYHPDGSEPDEESDYERDGDTEGGNGEGDPATLEQAPQDVTAEAVAAQPQTSSGLCRDLVRRD